MDRPCGALTLACTAVDAGVGIDYIVLCTLGDGLGGADSCACSAGDASVFNYVSHCCNVVKVLLIVIAIQNFVTNLNINSKLHKN